MVHRIQLSCNQYLRVNRKIIRTVRRMSQSLDQKICSKDIRQQFLDYFVKENNHKFIKSSPVIPFCDPSIAFVNAGMNQFKGVFLGSQKPPDRNVANSQKCVRMGGKHNDMNLVGEDGYHHTFFEMLGNWSFDDYFKDKACQMAWEMLTKVYKLPKNRLYVTYFKGNESLGLEEDIETKEIWKMLGVPESRLIPFGVKDNFWEMGLTGPCGPCTEIHYDHIGNTNRASFINKGLHDLIELWNIVFIQYNRLINGKIQTLPNKHVDTGMGFERLTSILQGSISNYDTDNFKYLLKAIFKNSSNVPKYEGKFGEKDWNNLDKSYRILSDHSRAITVCLADGVIPEENQKLRRMMRKTFLICENVFDKPKGLVKELSNYVVENLGPAYPELEKNINQIHKIIDYEEDVYKMVRQAASMDWKNLTKENPKLLDQDIVETPNFISAYKDLAALNLKEINSKVAFRLYDSFGIDEEGIIKLAKALEISFNSEHLLIELESAKKRSKEGTLQLDNEFYRQLADEKICKTDDSSKYDYLKDNTSKYLFKELDVKVLKIYNQAKSVEEIQSECYCALVLDKTNLYSEAGGQIGDKGSIMFKNGIFDITSVENLNGYILHKGFFKSKEGSLRPHSVGRIKIDEEYRLNCMRNHTTTHLLNACLKKILGATCQKSSKVTDQNFIFDVALFGDKLNSHQITEVEYSIRRIIGNDKPVQIHAVNSQQLLDFDWITLIPGEVYPEAGIRIVEIKADDLMSREPCCGTHVLSTGDIFDFCIVGVKSLSRSTTSITAVTGEKAKLARINGKELTDELESLRKFVSDNIDKPELVNMALTALKKKLHHCIQEETVPVLVKNKFLTKLEDISNDVKGRVRENLRDFIEIEMKNALDSKVRVTKANNKYMVHYLRTSTMLENAPLQKATRICPDLPVLVIAYADNTVKARCCVPKNLKSSQFNAEKWLKETVAEVFKSKVAPPKGQDSALVCNMKARKIPMQELDSLLQASLAKAEAFADKYL